MRVSQTSYTFTQRIVNSIKEALPKGLKTAYWLLKITIPVSFAVVMLDYFGGIDFIAEYFKVAQFITLLTVQIENDNPMKKHFELR